MPWEYEIPLGQHDDRYVCEPGSRSVGRSVWMAALDCNRSKNPPPLLNPHAIRLIVRAEITAVVDKAETPGPFSSSSKHVLFCLAISRRDDDECRETGIAVVRALNLRLASLPSLADPPIDPITP